MTEARLNVLCDPGSLHAISPPGAGLWLGRGKVFGRPVNLHARLGAVLTPDDHTRMADFLMASHQGIMPLIGLFDSPGCRDGAGTALAAQIACFAAFSAVGTRGPKLGIICGEAVGFDAMLAASSDFTILSQPNGRAYMAGPATIQAITGMLPDGDELGTDSVDLVCGNELEALLAARDLIDLLCSQGHATILDEPPLDGLETILPLDQQAGYALAPLVASLTDRGCMAFGSWQGQGLFTGIGRLGTRSIGLLASNATHQGGALDTSSCLKGAAFVTRCAQLGLPIVTLVDCPGFLPGLAQERAGLLRAAVKLAQSLAAAPHVALTLRYGLGPAYAALTAGADGRRLYWPGALLGGLQPVDDPVKAGLADRLVVPAQSRIALATALTILAGERL